MFLTALFTSQLIVFASKFYGVQKDDLVARFDRQMLIDSLLI
jgi:hypothetical protein